jgi:hypothetical protein
MLSYTYRVQEYFQRIAPSRVLSAISATSTGTSARENGRTCNFGTINDSFDYANKNGLNTTEEV